MTFPAWLEPLPDAAQQRALDTWAIEDLGIPGATLMERAGTGLARAVAARAPDGPVAIVCGKGNNGGDGLVAARVLRADGHTVTVVEPGQAPELAGAVCVVDALLGTGFSGTPREPVASAIAAINAARARGATVVACDVPSGVDSSTGEVSGSAVRADLTVTFSAGKPGLWIAPGKDHAGEVHVVDIGIPAGDNGDIIPTAGLIGTAVLDAVPRRTAGSNKFTAGSVLVCGGSHGLTGAPAMSALGAARAGAGYVTVAASRSVIPALQAKLLEVMVAPLPDGPQAIGTALERAQRANAVVLGPGLGREDDAAAFARAVATQVSVPLVLDADGLNAFAGRAGDLAVRSAPTILTPHVGEIARLLEVSADEVDARRLASARQAATASGGIVVLKGDDTIVAGAGGRIAISPGGAPALATAGSGDVLSGIVAAYLAKRLDPFTAACAAVCVHVQAGRLAAAQIGPEGVIASDLIARLPRALTPGAGA